MGAHDKVIQGAAERLMEDERLRTNLTDEEAKQLMDWALAWLEARVFKAPDEVTARQTAQTEMTRLRPAISKINGLLGGDKLPTLANAVQALGLPATKTATNPLDRKGLIRALTTQLAESWRKQ
jgi:hypothetical protein